MGFDEQYVALYRTAMYCCGATSVAQYGPQ
jgi:hypothetical protein